VTSGASFEAKRGLGPLGTGVHVLGREPGPGAASIGDVWLTLLFVPVVPLGRWTMERQGESAWRVTGVAGPRLATSAARVAAGILAAVAVFLPAYVAVALFMGSKPIELGGLFVSAGAVVGVLGWLDATRDRVPLRDALRLARRKTAPPAADT
jgi:hypothetical protein